MLREVIRPTGEYYKLHIPKKYINKNIEVIVLPLFDLEKDTQSGSKSFNPKEFYGISAQSKQSIDGYLASSREEWEQT